MNSRKSQVSIAGFAAMGSKYFLCALALTLVAPFTAGRSASSAPPLLAELNRERVEEKVRTMQLTAGRGVELAPSFVDPNEPNNNFASATAISCSFASTGTDILPLGSDVDFYRLTGVPGTTITIDIDAAQSGSTLDPVLGAFTSSTASIGLSDDDPAPGEPFSVDSYLSVTMPADGVLYIVVTAFHDFNFDGGSDHQFTGPYTALVHCSDPNEANNSFATATPISTSYTSVQTEVDPVGVDVDFYRMTGVPGTTITLDIDAAEFGSPLDTVLGAFNSSFTQIAVSDDDPDPGPPEPFTTDSYLSVTMPADGILYVVVTAFADFNFNGGADHFFAGPYTLRTHGSDPNEPNDSPVDAIPISCNSYVSAQTEISIGDVDFYKLTGTPGSRVTVDIDASPASPLDSVLGIFDDIYLRRLALSDDDLAPGDPPNSSLDSYVSFVMPGEGYVFVAVSSYADFQFNGGADHYTTGPYGMLVNCVDPNEPNNTFATATPISCPYFESSGTTIATVGSDVDFYLLTGTPGAVLTVDVDAAEFGSNLDSMLGAFNSSFASLGISDNDPAPSEPLTLDSYLSVTVPANGIVYLAVTSFNDSDFDGGSNHFSAGPYTLIFQCPTCGPLQESFSGPTYSYADTASAVSAQSFNSPQPFRLCSVGIPLNTNSACNMTLSIRTGPTNAAAIYTQASVTTTAGASNKWFMFDVPDIDLLQNQDYYIVLSGCPGAGNSWPFSLTNAYPRGDPYSNGIIPITGDYAFRTYGTPIATSCTATITRIAGEGAPSPQNQNVGEFVGFRATVPAPAATEFQWSVDGNILKDYCESVTNYASWCTTSMAAADFQPAPPGNLRFYWKPKPTQVHPNNDGPVSRKISVLVTRSDGSKCSGSVDVMVERNNSNVARQSTDFYVKNHSQIVRLEHGAWHDNNQQVFQSSVCNPSNVGELFLTWHATFLSRFNRWRGEFGYDPLGTWDSGTPIPADPDIDAGAGVTRITYNANSNPYPNGNGTGKPTWFTVAGAAATRPSNGHTCNLPSGQTKLYGTGGFATRNTLGAAIEVPWHNSIHGLIGGNFGSMSNTYTATKDGIFWRWHNFLQGIHSQWLIRPGAGPFWLDVWPAAMFPFVAAPPPKFVVSFSKPVTGVTGGALQVAQGGLTLTDGGTTSLATSVTGSGEGPYEFTGFAPPSPGPFTVTLAPGGILDDEGIEFGGYTWSYTLVNPAADTDADGMDDGTEVSTYLTNPTRADSDDDGLSDAAEVAAGTSPHDMWSPPRPVPDGTFGTAMTASKLNAQASTIAVSWDITTCQSLNYKILYGNLSTVSSYALAGAACNLDPSGTHSWTGVPAGSLWFLVVSEDADDLEGAWGTNSAGADRAGTTPSGLCAATQRSNIGVCTQMLHGCSCSGSDGVCHCGAGCGCGCGGH